MKGGDGGGGGGVNLIAPWLTNGESDHIFVPATVTFLPGYITGVHLNEFISNGVESLLEISQGKFIGRVNYPVTEIQ